jgi:hypothetical protein
MRAGKFTDWSRTRIPIKGDRYATNGRNGKRNASGGLPEAS